MNNHLDHTQDSAEYYSPPWSTTTKAIVAATALILSALAIWRFRGFIAPFVLALLLAYILHPIITFVETRTSLKRIHAVLLIYLVLLLAGGGGLFALILGAIQQLANLTEVLPARMGELGTQIQLITDSISNQLPSLSARLPQPLQNVIDLNTINIRDYFSLEGLTQQALSLLDPVFSGGWNFAQAMFSIIALTALIFIVSIYIASDIPRIGHVISDLAHQPGYRQDADRLMDQFARVWNAYLRGQVFLGLVIGVTVTSAMLILGVENALALGLLSGILEFLPVLGPVIGGGAAVIVAFFQDTSNTFGLVNWQFGLAVLVVMSIIQQIENNILVPRIMGDSLDLHPLVVMFSVLMGASLAGILGAVLAAPVVATLQLLSSYGWRKMLDLPPFPPEEKPPPKEENQLQKQAATMWQRLVDWSAGKAKQRKSTPKRRKSRQ